MRNRPKNFELLEYKSPILIAALQELLRVTGWKKKQLAEHVGFYPSVLNEWFQNRSVPSVLTLEKLCDGCGITLDELWKCGREIVEEQRRLAELDDLLEDVDPEITERVKAVAASRRAS